MPLRRALLAKLDDLREDGFAVGALMEEDFDDGFQCREEDAQRKLQHDGSDGAAEDDHGGGGLGDLSDASAFDHHAGENADDGEYDSTDAGDIHGSFLFSDRGYSPESLAD